MNIKWTVQPTMVDSLQWTGDSYSGVLCCYGIQRSPKPTTGSDHEPVQSNEYFLL